MSYKYAVPQDNFGQLEKLAAQQNEIALQKAMQPSTSQRLIGAVEGIGHSLLDYDRGRKKREMDERKELAMRAMSRNDYEFDINQLNNWVMTGQGVDGSKDIPVTKVNTQQAADKQAKEWALKSNVAVNPATGKQEFFTINPDPKIMDPKERYVWSGIEATDKYAASKERTEIQMAKAAVDYMFKGGVITDVDILNNKQIINQKKLARKIATEKDPLVLYWLKRMQSGDYKVGPVDEGQGKTVSNDPDEIQ